MESFKIIELYVNFVSLLMWLKLAVRNKLHGKFLNAIYIYRERERERERERDRQTDRQTDRERQRQTDRQTQTDI